MRLPESNGEIERSSVLSLLLRTIAPHNKTPLLQAVLSCYIVLVRLQVNENAEQDEDENQTNVVERICHYKPHCLFLVNRLSTFVQKLLRYLV